MGADSTSLQEACQTLYRERGEHENRWLRTPMERRRIPSKKSYRTAKVSYRVYRIPIGQSPIGQFPIGLL